MSAHITNNTELESLFSDKSLYLQALTHKSWLNENPEAIGNNERLEFLGDAVLEFVVSSYIFKKFTDKEEGFLTALRANIVNTQNLAKFAQSINLGEMLKMSKGEEQGNGRNNVSLLADTVEAIIGALYINGGLPAAKAFITDNILADMDDKLAEPLKDPKSLLQEAVQATGLNAPRYKVIDEHGPDHNKEFKVEVNIENGVSAMGAGKSKSKAEQDAAKAALVKIELKS
jgi:ribonuclease-3